jgi:hypothetical protein
VSSLVIVTDRDLPKRLAYFRSEARQLGAQWGRRTVIQPARDARDVVATLALWEPPLERLALVGHGGPAWWLHARRGVRIDPTGRPRAIGVDELAAAIARVGAVDIHVGIAACWTAADRRALFRSPYLYGPGGAQSFAGTLYRGIVAACPRACVIGHTRKGRTAEAPHLRAWGGRYGVENDGRGVSVLDYYLGHEAHLDAVERTRWERLCAAGPDGATGAERVLAGFDPPGLARRRGETS